MLNRNRCLLKLLLSYADYSNSITEYLVDETEIPFDPQTVRSHLEWLELRGYTVRSPVKEPVYRSSSENRCGCYRISPLTERGEEYLRQLKRNWLRRFLEAAPDSTLWLLVLRILELVGAATILGEYLVPMFHYIERVFK